MLNVLSDKGLGVSVAARLMVNTLGRPFTKKARTAPRSYLASQLVNASVPLLLAEHIDSDGTLAVKETVQRLVSSDDEALKRLCLP